MLKSVDPTRCELESFLNQPLFAEFDTFDKQAAIYWFANHWHDGQTSSLYSVLSTSLYNPGPMERGPDHDDAGVTAYLYNELVEEFMVEIQ